MRIVARGKSDLRKIAVMSAFSLGVAPRYAHCALSLCSRNLQARWLPWCSAGVRILWGDYPECFCSSHSEALEPLATPYHSDAAHVLLLISIHDRTPQKYTTSRYSEMVKLQEDREWWRPRGLLKCGSAGYMTLLPGGWLMPMDTWCILHGSKNKVQGMSVLER